MLLVFLISTCHDKVYKLYFQEDEPIYIAVKGVVFDVTSGKGKITLQAECVPPPSVWFTIGISGVVTSTRWPF